MAAEPVDHHETPPRPAALSGVLAAAIVFGAGVVLCTGLAVVVWLASDAGSAPDAMRAGAGFWLAAHGSGVTVGTATITIVPLGVPVLAAVALGTATRRLGGPGGTGGVPALVAGTALAYGAMLAATAVMAGSHAVSFSPVRVGLIGCVLAAAAATVGGALAEGGLRAHWRAVPEVVRGVTVGCGAALAGMLAVATLVVLLGLAIGFRDVAATFDALGPGFLGGAALVLLCVLVLPNAVLLAVAVLLGPGFAIGSGTSVTLTQVRLGDLPAVPLVAALPDPGTQPAWVGALGVLPVLAGVLGGVLAVRDAQETLSLYDALARGCMAGGAAGVLLGLAVTAAGGAAGPGRMADVGAVMWCVPIAVAAMAVGGTAGAGLHRLWRHRATAEPSAGDGADEG